MRARAGWLQLSQLRLAAVARPPRVGVNLGALSCTLPTLARRFSALPTRQEKPGGNARPRPPMRWAQATGRLVQGDLL